MPELLLDLDRIGPHDRSRVGGKAMHLARLAQRQLPVPSARVVPTDIFREALGEAGLEGLASEAHRHPDESTAGRLALTVAP